MANNETAEIGCSKANEDKIAFENEEGFIVGFQNVLIDVGEAISDKEKVDF